MRIEGEYIFNGPREEVWEVVRDPEVLATAFPGTQSLTKVSESDYEVAMNIRVGPVAGVFAGRIVVSNEVPPESCTLTVDGKGAPGFASGVGDILLVAQDDGTTLMKYEGEMQVGGKLASVGQRLLDTASKSIIRQGLEALNQALLARIEAKAAGKEVEYIPPTEAQFATAVARDMAREMLPPPRSMGLVAIIALLALLLGFWLGRRCTDSRGDHCTGCSE